MNNVAIKTEQLDELINKLENNFNNINNNFLELDKKMNLVSLENNEVWDSPAQTKMYEYYTTIQKLIPMYANKFTAYISFLKSISSNYKANEQNSLNVLETNKEELNINGGE